MYLKSIDLQGFKSFADNTKLEFSAGVTGIVGPNGCGKSNVVDAVRWVLGETSAKALRGDEMADVIFSGTDRRRALGAAEVTLTLADCEEALGVDYNEVAITRRVSREGKGEYFVNGTRCRLRDIHELFADTGIGRSAYSIMAQGQIDQILSSRPEDRRAVFEEAAGITRFKQQKKEALRKLEYTDANLVRVTDIIEEVGRQKNSLQRQAAKARRYRLVRNELHVLEGHHLHRQWTTLASDELGQRHELAELDRILGEQREAALVRERGLSAQREALGQLDGKIERLREEMVGCESSISSARQRIGFNEERVAELGENARRAESEIASARAGLADQQGEIEAADASIAELEQRLEAQRCEVGAAERMVADARRQRQELALALAQARQKSQHAASQRAGLAARIEQQEHQLAQLAPRAERLVEDENAVARHEEEARQRLDQLENKERRGGEQLEQARVELEQAEANLRAAREAARESAEVLEVSRRSLTERESRLSVLIDLLEQGEGMDSGARAVLQGLPGRDSEMLRNGVRGVLASLLKVRDSADTPAIEAALGSALQAVVLADDAVLEATTALLAEKKLGRALLVSEEMLPPSPGSQVETLPAGARAWALDLVELDPKAARLFEHLLERVLVVDDLATAFRLRAELARSYDQGGSVDLGFATRDGQWLAPSGLVRGGAGKEGTSLLERQAEVRELGTEVARLREDHQAAEEAAAGHRNERDRAGARLDEAKTRVQELKGELSAFTASLASARRELEAAGNRLGSLRWEREQLDARSEEIVKAIEEGRTALAEAEESECAASSTIEEREGELDSLSRQEDEAAAALAERRTALAVEEKSLGSLRAQRQPMGQRARELEALVERRRSEVEDTGRRIEAARVENERLAIELEENQVRLDGLEGEHAEAGQLRAERRTRLADVQEELTGLQRELSARESRRGEVAVRLTQLELKLDNLEEQARERHHLRLPQFVPDWPLLVAVMAGEEAPDLECRELVVQVPVVDGVNVERSGDGDGDVVADAADADADTPLAQGEEAEARDAEAAEDQQPRAARLEAETPPPEPPPEVDWAALAERTAELRRRLEGMGPVNLDAIDEFEELVERHEFLIDQHADLVNAKDALMETIIRLNQESRQRFVETFEQVRGNFRRIFGELFGKGAQANLVLMDEEDPLESGIEVIAKPPGKKLQSISLLSGGERSMTAVALLFSIYQVKPSPFCVLDELDAPLDESNIGRFVGMLDRFIAQSQFIIVTHSKRTMQRCDVLYGVTMEEFGVSKPVGMRLAAAQAVVDRDARVAGGQAAGKASRSSSQKAAAQLSAEA